MTREPFIAHSELTNEIYIVVGKEKYRVTEQAIKAVMAIKALEQEDILNKIRAKIEGWQVDIHDNESDADEHDFVFERIFEIVDEILELIKKAFIEKEPGEETDNTMKVYEVHYISGRTERYSVARVKAANKEGAISKVFEMEGEAFENRLVLTKIIEEIE